MGVTASKAIISIFVLILLSPSAIAFATTGTLSTQANQSCAAPTIQLSAATIHGLGVGVNGGTNPGGSSCSITSMTWTWGDPSQSTSSFPAAHIYASSGTYTVTVTSHQSNGKTAQASEQVTVAGPSNLQVMVNLITWSTDNGWSLLKHNINSVSEITIFNAFPQQNGTISYNGNAVNVPQVIQAAHAAGVEVALGVGGAAPDSAAWPALTRTYNDVLNSANNRTVFVNNIVSEITSKSYDAVQWDFENQNNGDFSATNYALMIGQARQEMPNVEFDCVFAPFMSMSVNITALSPYCNHFLYAFPNSTGYSTRSLASYSQQIGSASKLSVGYDLSSLTDPTYHFPKTSDLTTDQSAGYGVFFFQAGNMTQALYNEVKADFGNSGTGTIVWSVSQVTSSIRQSITITGFGFGTNPTTTPLADGSVDTVACNTAAPSLDVRDSGAGADSWYAGRAVCTSRTQIGIYIVSWTNTQIVLSGFGSELGNPAHRSQWNIQAGNPLEVDVFGPNNGGQASYTETVT